MEWGCVQGSGSLIRTVFLYETDMEANEGQCELSERVRFERTWSDRSRLGLTLALQHGKHQSGAQKRQSGPRSTLPQLDTRADPSTMLRSTFRKLVSSKASLASRTLASVPPPPPPCIAEQPCPARHMLLSPRKKGRGN